MAALLQGPAIAKLVNEGYGKPNADQQLPIDINYQRLTEWLVGRQKLPADWHKRVAAIQGKVSQAIKELPQGLLAALPGGTDAPVDYFRARQIRDKLAETADRTLFGGLSGEAGTWDAIVKAYEKGGIFMGEAAQTMVQNADYEIPYLRKQMAKHSTVLADADRKAAEYERSAATCAANYKQECQKLGIHGQNVRQELRALGQQLPALLQEAVEQLRSGQLQAAMDYYRDFIRYAHSSSASSSGGESSSGAVALLPTLSEVREGRTEAPAAIAAEGAAADPAATAAAVDIDWDFGDGGTGGGAPAAAAGDAADIDWDLGALDVGTYDADGAADGPGTSGEGAGVGAAPVDISWEVTAEGAGADAAPAISWDIEVTESAAAAAAAGVSHEVNENPSDARAAGGSSSAGQRAGPTADATLLRLQDDSDYRSRLMDDLQELRAFLLQRRSELGSSELLQVQMPEAIQSVDKAAVAVMVGTVDAAISRLNDRHLRQLLMITTSQRYLDRLVGSLQRKAGQEAKMMAAAREVAARKQEARAALVGLGPKVAELVERTKHIKAETQVALSMLLGGRCVNVLGEINNVLTAAQQ